MLVHEIARNGAIKYHDEVAIKDSAGNERTFAELFSDIQGLASTLREVADKGDRIAILAHNSVWYLEALIGIPAGGMVATILNYRLHPAELIAVMTDCEPVVLLAEESYLRDLELLRDQIPSVRTLVRIGPGSAGDCSFEALTRNREEASFDERVDPDAICWLIYTSGTTGKPKGVMLSHRNILAGATNWLLGVTDSSDLAKFHPTYLMSLPLCHVSAVGVLSYLMVGGTVILHSEFDAAAVLSEIARSRVTVIPLAPIMIHALVEHPLSEHVDLTTLRAIHYGTAPTPLPILNRALLRLPHVEFFTAFGMTELSGSVLCLGGTGHREALSNDDTTMLSSVGTMMPLAAMRIVDEHMRDVRVGDVGELVVRGDQVTIGYWGQPETTVDAWVGGWFHTGDLARRDERGFHYIVDRIKDMIISGGENVYAREVEEVLYRHEGIAEAAVLGIPDEEWGEVVAAAVVLREGRTLSIQEISSHCRSALAGYKVPRLIYVVSELPRNATGKVVKARLRESLLKEVVPHARSRHSRGNRH